MISHRVRRAARNGSLLLAMLTLVAVPVSRAGAQYFGRNKVQYEKFNWKILRSDHFDNFFYPSESLIVHDAGRLAERWYTRHSDTFRHAFDRKSLIFRTSSRPMSSASSWARRQAASRKDCARA